MSTEITIAEAPAQNAVPASLLDLSPTELERIVSDLGEPAYRARQLFQALHHRKVSEWAELTDLPARLRSVLAERYAITPSTLVQEVISADGTRKQLVQLHDGSLIETVAIPARSGTSGASRLSVCVSTQAGCAMACTFCATGRMGARRNLSTAEILDQVYGFARTALGPDAPGPTHVVFMGMGEPLANFAATVQAVRLLSHPEGARISQRRLTVSTSGLVPQIHQLADERLEITLAISLHAPDDELRTRLMPINRRWPIAELIAAGDAYADRTHRRVSYEYVLLGGVNDRLYQADALARLLKGRLAHVNLIPYNATDADFARTPAPQARAFRDRLTVAGLSATIRASRGQDITAACGQLATGEELRIKS